MTRWLWLWLLLPSMAHAIAILPGGGGSIGANGVAIGGSSPCGLGEAAVSDGAAWGCNSVASGTGDSAQINGAAVTDINFLDSATIAWTRDTTPAPDTAVTAVVNGSIGISKLATADYGSFTCAAGVSCLVDNDAIALGTKTTGKYVGDITAGTGMQCIGTGCAGADGEEGTVQIGLNPASSVTWTGIFSFALASLKIPNDTNLAAAACLGGSGCLFEDVDAPVGRKLYVGTPIGWELVGADAISVDGANVANPNFLTSGDLAFGVSGSDITPTIKANAVALGADTTNNYVQSAGVSGHLTCSGCTASEGSTPTVSITAASIDDTDIVAGLDLGGKTSFEVPNSAAPSTTVAGQIGFDTNAWASSRGAPQIFDGTANAYLVGVLASDVPLNGQAPRWNTGGTITWEDVNLTPAGSGTELQYRAGASTMGAVAGSSVSSGNITMTGALTAATVTATAVTAEPGNRIRLTANDTAFTNDPTCALSGTANMLTIIDKDETSADAWVICDGTSELINLTLASIAPANLSTAAKTHVFCANGISVTSAAVNIDLGVVPDASTLRKAWCIVRGTVAVAPTYTISECATDGSSCDANSATLTCGNTTTSTTTFSGSEGSSLAAEAVLQATSTNTPTVTAGVLMICAAFTPN